MLSLHNRMQSKEQEHLKSVDELSQLIFQLIQKRQAAASAADAAPVRMDLPETDQQAAAPPVPESPTAETGTKLIRSSGAPLVRPPVRN